MMVLDSSTNLPPLCLVDILCLTYYGWYDTIKKENAQCLENEIYFTKSLLNGVHTILKYNFVF